MINNIPEVKAGVIAVSRSCFPAALSERRRAALVSAYGEGLYECPDVYKRQTLSCSSSATRPCIWPPAPTPATSAASKPSRSSGIPARQAFHQSAGFCSLQPGCGKNRGYSFVTVFLSLIHI